MALNQKNLLHYRQELVNTLTHFIGAIFAIAALVLLVVHASLYGTVWHVVSFSVFGAGLTLFYVVSAIYHAAPFGSRTKHVFKKFDHVMIYILIAATYTLVSLTALRGGWGWGLFGVIWGLAFLGILIKLLNVSTYWMLPGVIYLAMGGLDIIAYAPTHAVLSSATLFWLVVGGALYGLGTIFFALDNIVKRREWFGMHEISHVFILLGSASHFWFAFNYLLYIQ